MVHAQPDPLALPYTPAFAPLATLVPVAQSCPPAPQTHAAEKAHAQPDLQLPIPKPITPAFATITPPEPTVQPTRKPAQLLPPVTIKVHAQTVPLPPTHTHALATQAGVSWMLATPAIHHFTSRTVLHVTL